jgi:hypothetical protein
MSPVAPYRYETWCLILVAEHSLRVCEDKMMRGNISIYEEDE